MVGDPGLSLASLGVPAHLKSSDVVEDEGHISLEAGTCFSPKFPSSSFFFCFCLVGGRDVALLCAGLFPLRVGFLPASPASAGFMAGENVAGKEECITRRREAEIGEKTFLRYAVLGKSYCVGS